MNQDKRNLGRLNSKTTDRWARGKGRTKNGVGIEGRVNSKVAKDKQDSDQASGEVVDKWDHGREQTKDGANGT